MIYAAASWHAWGDSPPSAGLVAELASAGFTGISFDPARQAFLGDKQLCAEIRNAVEEHDLTVTIHGNALILPDTAAALAEVFGASLVNITMNVAIRHDSRGMPIDAEALCSNLRGIIEGTPGSSFTVGIEDFPRDKLALEYFAGDLAPILDSPRLGELIDLGHMHFWLHSRPYYSGVTPEQYLANVPLPITEVHIHDNDGTRDAHLPLGEATIDLSAVGRGLRGIGFDGVCTVEIGLPDSVDDSVGAYAKSMRAAKAAIESTDTIA